MSVAENKAIVMRYMDEVWTKGNVDAIDELMAPDFAYSNWYQVEGNREFQKQKIAGIRATAPDLHATVHEIIGEGNTVALRYSLEGTMEGKHVIDNGAFIVHIAGGKIVDYWWIDKFAPEEEPV